MPYLDAWLLPAYPIIKIMAVGRLWLNTVMRAIISPLTGYRLTVTLKAPLKQENMPTVITTMSEYYRVKTWCWRLHLPVGRIIWWISARCWAIPKPWNVLVTRSCNGTWIRVNLRKYLMYPEHHSKFAVLGMKSITIALPVLHSLQKSGWFIRMTRMNGKQKMLLILVNLPKYPYL